MSLGQQNPVHEFTSFKDCKFLSKLYQHWFSERITLTGIANKALCVCSLWWFNASMIICDYWIGVRYRSGIEFYVQPSSFIGKGMLLQFSKAICTLKINTREDAANLHKKIPGLQKARTFWVRLFKAGSERASREEVSCSSSRAATESAASSARSSYGNSASTAEGGTLLCSVWTKAY